MPSVPNWLQTRSAPHTRKSESLSSLYMSPSALLLAGPDFVPRVRETSLFKSHFTILTKYNVLL